MIEAIKRFKQKYKSRLYIEHTESGGWLVTVTDGKWSSSAHSDDDMEHAILSAMSRYASSHEPIDMVAL